MSERFDSFVEPFGLPTFLIGISVAIFSISDGTRTSMPFSDAASVKSDTLSVAEPILIEASGRFNLSFRLL